MALKPLVGESAYLLFAIGVLGTGMLSIPVLTGSLSYMISEAFNWNEGFNKKWFEAPGFYMIMTVSLLLAGIIQFIGIPPVKALIYTAIGYGLIAPVLIAIILHICNNKNVMGKYTNNRTSNLIGLLTLLVMTLAALALITN
jgi:Mn2+/Fe2+ NRAMP family transporter